VYILGLLFYLNHTPTA